MSKFFASIIAFFMMILSWLGIGGGTDNKPVEPEVTTAIVTEAPTTEEPTTEEPTTEDPTTEEPTTEEPTTEEPTTEEPTTEPDSNIVRENAYKNNIALGCSYVKSREPYTNYPDTFGRELTDGLYSYPVNPSYTSTSQSGYTETYYRALTIDVDLGAVQTKLYSFEVSYLATDEAGINIPSAVDVFISDDGESWAQVGSAFIPEMIKSTVQRAVLSLPEYTAARYVRFSIEGTAAFVFLDEVFVFADKPLDEGQSFEAAIENAYDVYGAVKSPSDGENIDKSLPKTSLSQGKSYAFEGNTAFPFADDGILLTDGSSYNTYESGKYAGLEAISGQKLTIDLGETADDIAGVELEAYSRTPSGIFIPAALNYTAIAQDGTRTALGTRYAKPVNGIGTCTFTLELDKTVSAQKIEIEFALTPCTEIYLIDEVNVFAYREADITPPCYPPVEFSLEDNGEWDASAADYNEYQNLLLGCESQIITAETFNDFQNERNTPANSGLLTDGVHSPSANIYNGTYQIFYTCRSRQVIFDMGKAGASDKFVCEFTNQTGWAVYSPAEIKVFISENGCDWYKAGNVIMDTSIDDTVLTGTLELEEAVKIRYVCFEFRINIFAGCSELEIFGTKNTSQALLLADSSLEEVHLYKNKRIAPSEDILDGAQDMCLLYHSTSFGYTPENLLPYVAYIDRDGEMTDIMFDSFLFLLSGAFPSGLSSATDGKLTDWEWCIEDLFTDGENILALEEAAGTAKEALGLPEDYVYPFTVAVYCPSTKQAAFGDVDGDGINEDLTTSAGRIKTLCAYADMFEAKLAQYNFQNIKFSGYYWMKESMDTANKDDEVAKGFSDYIHTRGYDFMWIPYHNANGVNNWGNYGFDCAVLQPNYVFTEDIPLSRFGSTANITELYGLGIEIEVSTPSMLYDNYYKRYMQYLLNGVKYGYMDDTISMYYQELLLYGRASKAEGKGRLLYENTYGYIKGTLDITPDTLETQYFSCSENEIFSGALALPESLWHEVTLVRQPEHGTVTMCGDGTFMYYPEKDFTGSVEIKFTYTLSFEQSAECTAIITVN